MGNSHSQFFISSIILSVSFLISLVLVVNATSRDDITFPISELGNCRSEEECKSYCDQRDNLDVIKTCLAFAKKHNLLSKNEIEKGERFAEIAVKGGPGGCKNERDCVSYCENIAHIQECLAFAERYGFLSSQELDEAKKVARALRSGLRTPGSCNRKSDCLAYCENPAHLDECLAFAERAGFLPPEELQEAKKFLPLIKSGETPGGCSSKRGCEEYCSKEEHFEECAEFGAKVGFVSEKELELVRKSRGRLPGNCARGARSAEEAKRACAHFCNQPENQQACFRFAAEIGMVSLEEASQIGSFSDFQSCLPHAPERVRACIEEHLGTDLLGRLERGIMPFHLEEAEEMIRRVREARGCINRRAGESFQTFTDNPDALACIDSELGRDFIERMRSGNVQCGEASEFQRKIAACLEGKLNQKLDRCFALPCSEATACIRSIQGGSPRVGGEGIPLISPELHERLSSKLNSCVGAEIRGCLSRGCDEIFTCVTRLRSQASGGGEGEGLDPALERELTAKIQACSQSSGGSGVEQHQTYPEGSTISGEICQQFASAPSCSYVGPPDSEAYQYCRKCFPDR